jgi:tetratricopeptide (TPR) repeat protein
MAAAGQHRFAIVALLCCIPFASQLALGCANPTTAYHRQFEYLRDVGDEALAEGRLEEAHEHLSDAAQLARIAGASELEFIEALTRLTQASRRLGRLSEASRQARTASRVLARHRLVDGSGGRALARVGGSYLLERARLEIALGDLAAAEVALVDFFRLRGEAGGNARDATEARWLRGELWLARGLSSQTQTQIQAQAEFRSARDSARSLDQVRDRPLVGYVAFRVAEAELASGRTSRATALVDEMRPGGMIVAPALRPGMLLLQARIDVAQGNRDRASVRLAESLILLAPGDDDADAGTADVSAPARAIFVASLVFDAAQSGEKLREAVARALDIAEGSSSLRSIHAGREAVTVGRELFDAGARQVGLQTMGRGRQIIALGLRGNDHEALVAVDFELAAALADADRLKAASARCDALVEASERLADPVRLELPERLLACGQIHARRGDATSARRIFARALLLGGDAPLEPQLRMELLLRMGALAHQQKRESEEDKLFERVLALILPGSHERVSELLVDTYRSLGWFAPSSAAARLAHVAARHPVYTAEARPLQAIAEELGDRAPPASP